MTGGLCRWIGAGAFLLVPAQVSADVPEILVAVTGAEPPGAGAGLARQIAYCWVEPEVGAAHYTVGFALDAQGRVEGEIVQLGSSSGDAAVNEGVLAAARRAILRCQGEGYDLSSLAEGGGRQIELTFAGAGG